MDTLFVITNILICICNVIIVAATTAIIPTILSKKCFSDLEVEFIKNNIFWIRLSSITIVILMLALSIYGCFMY